MRSSSVVYKSVMLNCLEVCAEKVVEVSDPSKRAQLRRELESLKQSQGVGSPSDSGKTGSRFIVKLLEVLSNPFDGTLSVCLEYLDGGTLQAHRGNGQNSLREGSASITRGISRNSSSAFCACV